MHIYITNSSVFCMHPHTCTAVLHGWVFACLQTASETQRCAAMQSLAAAQDKGEDREQ